MQYTQRLKRCFENPTDPFSTLELQNLSHDIPELNRFRRSPGFKIVIVPVRKVRETYRNPDQPFHNFQV